MEFWLMRFGFQLVIFYCTIYLPPDYFLSYRDLEKNIRERYILR